MPTHGAQQRAQGTTCDFTDVVSPAGTWGGIRRHRLNGESLCEPCRTLYRDYYRAYERIRRQNPVERARKTAARQRWREANREHVNAYERRRYHQQRRADQVAARRTIDPVVVDRLVNGEPAEANRAETRAAFHRLRTQGHTLTAACTQLRLSGSTGRRYEAARTASNVIEVAHTAGTDCLEETG